MTGNALGFVRPKTLFWFSLCTVVGFSSVLLLRIPPLSFFRVMVPILLLNIGAIIVNDIADRSVDEKSHDDGKASRPLVSGSVSVRRARLLAISSFLLALLVSGFIGTRMLVFTTVITALALAYSLPPLKLSSRRIGSLLFWPVLCVICYVLWADVVFELCSNPHEGLRGSRAGGWTFLIAISAFMGIGEIIAKDLRDLECDRQGGRRTFTGALNPSQTFVIMTSTAWLGLALWIYALYLTGRFPSTIISFFILIIGIDWCIKLTAAARSIRKVYDPPLAKRIHDQWTRVYAVMQLFTAATFIE
jgi:4-hydroxybenzoate polyprenyltransferase